VLVSDPLSSLLSILGDGVRVVSVPCFEIFDRQSAAYKVRWVKDLNIQ
jgi:transketolase